MSTRNQNLNYRTALDLQQDPFSPDPDSLFYLPFDAMEQRLEILKKLVQGADHFILVVGEQGSGKTTLLNRYLASIESQWRSVRIRADAGAIPAEASGSRAKAGYPAILLQELGDPVIIVDDAHRLARKRLENLIHDALKPGNKKLPKRLVLFGEATLYTTVRDLAEASTAQPAVNQIHLAGLTREQTAEYIRHRLTIAGHRGKFPFKPPEINTIHQRSGGYPGPINKIAHQRLKEKYSSQKKGRNMLQKLSANPRRVVAWAATVVAILALAALWHFSDRNLSADNSSEQKLAKIIIQKQIVPDRQSADRVHSPKVTATNPPVKPPNPIQQEQAQRKPALAPEPASAGRLEKATPPESTPPQQPAPAQLSPSPTIATIRAEAVPAEAAAAGRPEKTSAPQAIPPQQPEPVQQTPVLGRANIKAETIVVEPTVSTPPQEKLPHKTGLPPMERQPPPAPAVPITAKTTVEGPHREKWLLAQNGAKYTVQIIGVSNEKSMTDFIERHPLLQHHDIAYYESTFRGKPWYQLLYGLYTTKQDAILAANNLPENIRRAGPWIRKIASVQRTIVRRRNTLAEMQ